jgi:hypothetical protein
VPILTVSAKAEPTKKSAANADSIIFFIIFSLFFLYYFE